MKNLLIGAILILTMSGCSTLQSMMGLNYNDQQRSRSSLVDYLYPNSRGAIAIKPKIPSLSIPLRVGIAFVPDSCGTFLRHDLNETLKNKLLTKISSKFESKEIIDQVKVIPATYLRRKGSFNNLRDIKKQLDVDIIVLLSYDQVQYTERTAVSLIYYWTVVGRYIFEGEKNDTVTLVNAAVYDIDSEELLFSSNGNSKVRSRAASAFISEELRVNSQKGFDIAIDNLIVKTDIELERFRQKVKAKTVAVKVHYRSGGGSFGWFVGLLLILVVGRLVPINKYLLMYENKNT